MKQIDMSSEAITRRLRQASQLRDLSLSLIKAKKAHDDKMRDAEKHAGKTLNDSSKREEEGENAI